MPHAESESMLHGTHKKQTSDTRNPWSRISLLFSTRPPRKLLQFILASTLLLLLLLASTTLSHSSRPRFLRSWPWVGFGTAPPEPVLRAPNMTMEKWRDVSRWRDDTEEGGRRVRKAVVLASYAEQDVRWLRELNGTLTSGWEVYRYVSDATPLNATSDMIPLSSPYSREGLAYITFILEHYSNLPDYVVFIHGHLRSWHQPASMLDRLSALNLRVVEEEGYVSLQCMGGGCGPRQVFRYNGTHSLNPALGMRLEDFWDDMMLSHGFGHLPPIVGRQCCAQFAVSKAAILQHPRALWEDFRQPLLGYEHERPKWHSPILKGFNLPGHRVGLYYEMIWHILFGKAAVHCPTFEWCEQVAFQGAIKCDRNIMGWGQQRGWQNVSCSNKFREGLEGQEGMGLEVDLGLREGGGGEAEVGDQMVHVGVG